MKRTHKIVIYIWLILITGFLISIALEIEHLNYNLNVVYHNQGVIKEGLNILGEQMKANNNSIKIQLPDGYKLDDSQTNLVDPNGQVR